MQNPTLTDTQTGVLTCLPRSLPLNEQIEIVKQTPKLGGLMQSFVKVPSWNQIRRLKVRVSKLLVDIPRRPLDQRYWGNQFADKIEFEESNSERVQENGKDRTGNALYTIQCIVKSLAFFARKFVRKNICSTNRDGFKRCIKTLDSKGIKQRMKLVLATL